MTARAPHVPAASAPPQTRPAPAAPSPAIASQTGLVEDSLERLVESAHGRTVQRARVDPGYDDIVEAARRPAGPAASQRAAPGGLPSSLRAKMESALDADFSAVQLHPASTQATALGARAFTQGADVHVAPGHWAPETAEGQALIGHELAHVVQQRDGRVAATSRLHGLAHNDDATLEREADAAGARAAAAPSADPPAPARQAPPGAAPPAVVQRSPDDEHAPDTGRVDVLPDPIELTWATDRFRIALQRSSTDNDLLEILVRYMGPRATDGPPGADPTRRLTLALSRTIPFKARITRFTDALVEIDLYGDRSEIVRVTDRTVFENRPDLRGRRHEFTLDRNGRPRSWFTLWVVANDARASDIPARHADISPGTSPDALIDPADGARQIYLDGDGDQYPELLLRILLKRATPDRRNPGAPPPQGTVKTGIEVIQLATSARLFQQDFDGPAAATATTMMLPLVKQVTDGKLPTVFSMFLPEIPGGLEIYPPDLMAKDASYRLVWFGQSANVPYRDRDAAHRVAVPDQAVVVGNIVTSDVALGAYGDRFRLTFQPTARGTVIFGISALSGGEPMGAAGAELPFAKPIRFRFVETGATSLGIDLDDDGKAEIQLFDQLTTPDLGGTGKSVPESERNHRVRLTTTLGGGDRVFDFTVQDNHLQPGGTASPSDIDRAAEANALAVSSLAKQAELVDKAAGKLDAQGELEAVDRVLDQARVQARDQGLIRLETFQAWDLLARDFLLIHPGLGAPAPDNVELRHDAAGHAKQFYAALASETRSAERTLGAHGVYATENRYTDLNTARERSPGEELVADIEAGRWASAIARYRKLVDGLDRWIAHAAHEKYGAPDPFKPMSNFSGQVEYLAGLRKRVEDVQSHHPIRIAAVYHPQADGTAALAEVPLSLYYYRDGDTWHLQDVTDDDAPDETARVGAGETEPPFALFAKLADSPHYPRGTIHYQLPSGSGGQVHPTGPGTWRKVLTWIGIGLAAIGLGLVTFGEGTVAVIGAYALGASAAVGGGMAALDLVERGMHGNLSARTAILDAAQIVASISGLGVLRAGRILSVARAAAADSVPLTESAALAAGWASRYIVPLAGANIAADTITLAIVAEDGMKQLDAIDRLPGTADSRAHAKLLLLGQLALTTGLTALSVRGNAAEITYGRNLDIVIVRGVPVALPKGSSVMGKAITGSRPRAAPGVDEATFFAAEQAHLANIRGAVRTPAGQVAEGGEALAQVEDLALRGAYRAEEARRIFEPIAKLARSLTDAEVELRRKLTQLVDDMQAVIDDAGSTAAQRQAALRARVKAFEAGHPALRGKIDLAAVDAGIAALGNQGTAGVMIADASGKLLRNGQPSGTLQDLAERVARANNASAAHGIETEYVVDIRPGPQGTRRVEVIGRPRSPRSTPAGRPSLFVGVAERGKAVGDTLARLRGLHPESHIELLPDGGVRVNGQLEILPSELDAMPAQDVADLLKLTREVQAHGGEPQAGAAKKALDALKKKYRLVFEYERRQADEMLRRLGLMTADGASVHPIFEHMSTVDRNRLVGSVVNASIPAVETSAGTARDPALRSQAIDYALSRNPESVASFVRHFEFYLAEFERRFKVKQRAFEDAVIERATAAGTTDPQGMARARAKLIAERGFKKLDPGLRGEVLTEMGDVASAVTTSSATRAGVAQIYDAMAKAVGARYGGGQLQLGRGETPASLSPDEVVRRIQALGNDVTFSTLEAAVYHARKHFKELPDGDVQKLGKVATPAEEMTSYLDSVTAAIRHPEASAADIAAASSPQGESRRYTFRRQGAEVIVYVNAEGKVTVASYGKARGDAP